MKNKQADLRTWVITFSFRDGQTIKYVVKREQFWQAKEEAEESKTAWTEILSYSIKEADSNSNKVKKQSKENDKKSRRNKDEFE